MADTKIKSSNLADLAVTHDKLHTDMNLTSKTVQVATPTADSHPATKDYVDTEVAGVAGVSSFSYDAPTEVLTIATVDGGSFTADVSSLASESYVDSAVSNLIDSAPGALDTLNELAAALGDDANFSTTVTTNLSGKVDKINITGATVGSAASVPVITFNAQGQITSATTTAVAGVSSTSFNSGVLTINTSDGNSYTTDFDTRYFTETESNANFLGANAKAVDSDLLDGLNSTQFLRSDTSDSMSGTLTVISALDAPIVTQSTDPTTGITFTDSGGTGYLHYVGTSDYFYTQSNLHVGGSSSPGDKLTISGGHLSITSTAYGIKLPGAITSDGQINYRNAGSSVVLNSYPLANQTIRLKGSTDLLNFESDKTGVGSVLAMNTSGNVGIGTSSPDFTVDVTHQATGQTDVMRLKGHAGNAFVRFQDNDNSADWTFGSDDNAGAGAGALIAYDRNNSAYRFVIDSSGNVGIGTSSPQAKLHIKGGSNEDAELRLFPSDGSMDAVISFTGQDDTTTSEGAQIWYDNDVGDLHIVSSYDNSNGGIRFHTRQPGHKQEGNERLTIAGDGNVGIGTSNPGYKLHVAGEGYFSDLRVNDDLVFEGNGTSRILGNGQLDIYGTGTNTNIEIGTTASATSYPNSKVLYVLNGNSDNIFTVQNNGNVGIGTTSINQKLTVNTPRRSDGGTNSLGAAVIAGPVSVPDHDFTNSTAIFRVQGSDATNNIQFGVGNGSYNYHGWIQASYDNTSNYGAKDLLLQPIGGSVVINQTSPSYSSNDNTPVVGTTTANKLHVNGSIQLLNNDDAIVFGRGTSSFMKDEEIGFGWGGGWYMNEGTLLRVRGNKHVHSTGPATFSTYYGDGSNLSGISGTPAGAVIYHAGSTPPTGFIKANGASLSTSTYAALFSAIGYTYGGSGGSFNVPDLRGEFLRGWDDSRGVDSGRTFGSSQLDQMQRITGYYNTSAEYFNVGSGTGVFTDTTVHTARNVGLGWNNATRLSFDSGNSSNARVSSSTSGETRSRNVALLACIKF